MIRILSFLFFCAGTLIVSANAEMREWVNAEGTRKIKGEFVKLEGDQLTLKKPDGKEMTFSTSFLQKEDRELAEKESKKPKTELPKLIGARGKQAFDSVDFGGTPDETAAALRKSGRVVSSGGTAEFFGQKIEGSDFVAKIDDTECKLEPVYKGGVLDEVHIYGEPYPESKRDAMRSKWAETKMVLIGTFGPASEEFLFPKLGEMEDNANGMTHSWMLSGGRRLDLAIRKTGSAYSVTMRVVAGL